MKEIVLHINGIHFLIIVLLIFAFAKWIIRWIDVELENKVYKRKLGKD